MVFNSAVQLSSFKFSALFVILFKKTFVSVLINSCLEMCCPHRTDNHMTSHDALL